MFSLECLLSNGRWALLRGIRLGGSATSGVEEDEHANENTAHQSRNLTEVERPEIYAALIERSNCGRLKRNATNIVAQMF